MGLEWDDAGKRARSATEDRAGCSSPGVVDTGKSHGTFVWEAVSLGGSGLVSDGDVTGGRFRAGWLLWDQAYKCAFCGGEGEKPPGSLCPVCRGSGRNVVQPPVVVCAFCRGKGEAGRRTNITCTSCKGYGVTSVKEPVEVCPTCRGRGKERGANLSCIRCKGSGVIEIGR